MAVYGVLYIAPSKIFVPPTGMHLIASHGKVVATYAGIGRGSGGIHGYRSRKRRRRRSPRSESGCESQGEVQAVEERNGASASRRTRNSGRSKRPLEPDGSGSHRLEEEVVAPVAVTIVSDPELFESVAHGNAQANSTVEEEEEEVPVLDEPQVGDESSDRASLVPDKIVEQVTEIQSPVGEVAHKVVDDVIPEQVTQAAEVLVEQVAALSVVEQVARVTGQVANLLSSDAEEGLDSSDEFEAFITSDQPEFRGIRGLESFTVFQESHGIMPLIYDFYLYILKKPVTEFALAMFAAPVAVSIFFTLLYLPQLHGLDFATKVSSSSKFFENGLELDWDAVFRVLMFSVSLSTGLQPELTPLTPYTLVIANINALVAQLLFVFLSGAVFARLSQPSQPIRCSSVALVCPSTTRRNVRVFMTRYVLAGPQPCELVDVKIDLSYKYNTITGAGTYFRATQSLKLVRSEVSYVTHGMLVRHIIDESSPLNKRTPEMLRKEDGIFTLTVLGLERSSMQPVFHAQHYSMDDDHVIWDADFQDMILINKKKRRIVDHSKLSQWRPVSSSAR